MKTTSIEMIHKELFELLVEFDKLCRANQIEYSIHGGTLIGSKRYGDFIPWDDDADVTMMSWDYEKLAGILNQSESGYHFTDDELGHRFTRKNREGRVMAWIDVIEYNYVTENAALRRLRNGLLLTLYAMSKNRESIKTVTVQKHGHLRVSLFQICYLLGRAMPRRLPISLHRYVSRKSMTGRKTLLQRTNDQARALRRLVPVEWYGRYEDSFIRGYPFRATTEYHKVLAQVYGEDWLTPPPGERRIPHQDAVREAFQALQDQYETSMAEKNIKGRKKHKK